jgi:hypothetical protein
VPYRVSTGIALAVVPAPGPGDIQRQFRKARHAPEEGASCEFNKPRKDCLAAIDLPRLYRLPAHDYTSFTCKNSGRAQPREQARESRHAMTPTRQLPVSV